MSWSSPFDYQLDLLKTELETVNASIRQMDEITKNVKQWAIGLWTAAVGGALAKDTLAPYVGFTAAIPLLFWLVDTWHRRIQRKFIWRTMQVSSFLNDGRLEQSFTAGKLIEFYLFDPQARRSRDAQYRRFVSWYRVAFFPSLVILYAGLALVSIGLSVLHAAGAILHAH